MTLIRRNYNDWPSISNLFDDFFSGDYADLSKDNQLATVPSVNISELSNKYKIELAAPGVTKDDFNIDLENNVLSIFTEKKEAEDVKESEYTKREFYYSNFRRSFTLPDTADIDGVTANYVNGVLYVEIAKKSEAVIKPKRSIDIN
ncbi:MAG: Hsp20/alpha crystallin family protein [Bacteroidales bacterium]|nr:Hsp20/alpha crystallin family protein [Bacteroidales bacterium]